MATPRGKLSQTGLTKEESKDALKAALKEWLDERLSLVGKWTLRGLAAVGLAVLAFLLIVGNGWGTR